MLPNPPPKHAGRILLADDDADTRELVALLLEHAGYEVRAVADGQQTIAAAAAEPSIYRLAVLDVSMPVMTGLEAAATLRVSWPWIRIVLHTSMEEDWVRDRFTDYHDYYRKPLDTERFMGRLPALMQ